MTFSQYAGVAIVPTLSRLVLGIAFVLFGYLKVFTESEFDAAAAQKLKNAGVPIAMKSTGPSAFIFSDRAVMLAAYRQAADPQPQDDPDPNADPEPDPSSQPDAAPQQPAPSPNAAPAQRQPASDAPAPEARERDNQPQTAGQGTQNQRDTSTTLSPTDPMNNNPLPPGTYSAKSLHQITLLLMEKTNWPRPFYFAWAAALTELFGGALLLIGLFSRLAGLGIAGVMGVAFYLTSLPKLAQTHVLELPPLDLTSICVQLAFFVLAFGIVLTGAGPLSFDRLLFTRPDRAPEADARRKQD